MNISAVTVAAYGILTLAGGVVGYLKAHSTASLVAGGTSGLVLLVCAYGIQKDVRAASFVALALALLLGLRFAGTWVQNHRFMPDLVMVILSALAFLAIVWDLFKR